MDCYEITHHKEIASLRIETTESEERITIESDNEDNGNSD
jgi:hypothetical protein